VEIHPAAEAAVGRCEDEGWQCCSRERDRERSRGWEREGLGWDERGMVGLKYISH
jgi:hypothetical protein